MIESSFTPARLVRWAYLGYISAKFTPVIVLALAIVGLWFFWRDRRKLLPRVWPLLAFVAMFTIAILFSAHGVRVNPETRVASREAHFWMAAVVFLAALALSRLPAYGSAVAAVGIAFGVWGAWQYVAREASDPRLQLSYHLAKFFDRELRPGQRALILSPPWDRSLFDFYLQRARETGGETRYQAALRNLEQNADMSPPDYQRMLIHSRLDRSRLLYEANDCTEWLAVWSDYTPHAHPEGVSVIEVIRKRELSVTIARRNCHP